MSEFNKSDHACCHFCNVMEAKVCSSEYQMSVIMTGKCLGYLVVGALSAKYFVPRYRLEVKDVVL